ncbi:hypothetical protein PPERSA_01198 [Pseudocohnilembus persalinus]|uniref:60S ribosomal protein L7a n=1 Tax=Pseudocohnilembus persalinus TaxID=266149 RepID=A0A0V0QBI4_PSEPJ|nr:hypothetical protein PPERSA_01198 [Pseudocohnilembus persalinus]|eukprot:KRW99552.1 hypothetical protein PPERSA_01198 [Pseudocohnilembus persalinus]
MAKGKKGALKTKKVQRVQNPLFESRPKNFRVGGDVRPKTDMSRFIRWPKYIVLQRQKRVLLQRLKVPPIINQFSSTLDKNGSSNLLKFLKKYSPETKEEKKARLSQQAQAKANNQKVEGKKPVVLKFGLNHITTLIENRQAKLVVIAHDVDPIELVLWLPQLCRKMDVPFAFVKSKARLGQLVHQKQATAVALTEVRKEDEAQLAQFQGAFKTQFVDNQELRRKWGGGIVGIKSQHVQQQRQAQIEREQLKKQNL